MQARMTSSVLPADSVVANRFVIERVAGSGGMGTVFRARDQHTGLPVALKILTPKQESERFAREAQVLAELHHPNIVSYIAHGQTPDGRLYLAMEWLDGEDLAQRLACGRLSLADSVILLRATASALAAAHRKGIVHRDIKPSNLFLRHSEVARVALIDFGIARRTVAAKPITKTGLLIGTPAYMAPEQARGERDITASADIFSLGCVLYECMTGEPLFVGDYSISLPGGLFIETAPALRASCPGISHSLETLIMQMVEPRPEDRPQSALELIDRLSTVSVTERNQALQLSADSPENREYVLGTKESTLFTALAATPAIPQENAKEDDKTAELSLTQLIEIQHNSITKVTIRRTVLRFGCQARWLDNGTLLAVFSHAEEATDAVTRAAHCALALREFWPSAKMGIVTTRLDSTEPEDLELLASRASEQAAQPLDEALTRPENSGTPIRIDVLSANLLDTRFQIQSSADQNLLIGERYDEDLDPLKPEGPMPCFGRERELGELAAVFQECADDSVAQAVLVLGPPGIGKSKLRHEFIRQLKSSARDVNILTTVGDPGLSSSAYGLLGQAIKRGCEIGLLESSQDLSAPLGRLLKYLQRKLPADEAESMLPQLAVICGLALPEEEKSQPRGIRQSLQAIREASSRALIRFFAAECAEQPLLLVVEDVQWADVDSLELIDALLRELKHQPFMVLALGRPEVLSAHPNLWDGRRLQTLELGPLSKKAAEGLVRHVLGASASGSTLSSILQRAGGNPRYLRQLLLAASGSPAVTPDALLTLTQVKLLHLEPGARRILRIASLFGPSFWRGGVSALLGSEGRPEEVDLWLRTLVEAELIDLKDESSIPGEEEFRWRRQLTREAALRMLTSEDLAEGSKRARKWLEDKGMGELAPQ